MKPRKPSAPSAITLRLCVKLLRAGRPPRYVRRVPLGKPTPFVPGLEREVGGPSTYLVQAVLSEVEDRAAKTSRPIWPLVTWWGWKTPTGARWTFGQVIPVMDASVAPAASKPMMPLNWNALAVRYTLR